MEELVKELLAHLSSISKEQKEKEFEELREFNDFGPLAKNYIDYVVSFIAFPKHVFNNIEDNSTEEYSCNYPLNFFL